jgi:cysteinyl-tRNA synthetase
LPKAGPPPLPPATTVATQPAARHRSLVRRALLGLALVTATAVGAAWLLDASIDHSEDGAAAAGNRAALAAVKSWGYQLQGLQVDRVAASAHDLVVVDQSLDDRHAGSEARVLSALQRKPDGSRRIVLSYLSVGEAEDFRPYWRAAWTGSQRTTSNPLRLAGFTTGSTLVRGHGRAIARSPEAPVLTPGAGAPAWLGPENPVWRGNFTVRFWHPDWRALLFGQPDAAIDRIIAAGFDGVYLDRADVYGLWRSEQPSAKEDMVDLVVELAAYARSQKPGFQIVLQNADELLASARLRRVLDGAAKEDLLYGLDQEGRENPSDDVQSSLHYLRQARASGLPVLVVEYLADRSAIMTARQRIESEGFVPYFGPRALNVLVQSN